MNDEDKDYADHLADAIFAEMFIHGFSPLKKAAEESQSMPERRRPMLRVIEGGKP